ncbi:MAG: hypothetical protein UR26_C0001G0166 [candidate division TM6 bacterium GW2011_GWF2_32_72]|nr:MAG: hypothetical protein UR26_C0001G0166 [candidate division TM6 bacterium GW2011_GWF2_32_72]
MFKKISLSASFLLLLSGCGYQVMSDRDYLKQFVPIKGQAVTVVEKKGDISLRAKVFDSKSCNKIFKKNLIKKGIQPIQLSFENNGKDTYILRNSYIDAALVPTNRVAKKLHWNTSLICVPTAIVGLIFYWPLALVIVPSMAIGFSKSNKKINKNLKYNGLNTWGGDVEIPPYSKVSKYIFVDSSCQGFPFDVSVMCQESKELVTFSIR